MEETNKYDDIINMPRHVSQTRPQMSRCDRAAQFSPFAALTGYEAVVKETARLTEDCLELAEDMKEILDARLRRLLSVIDTQPKITVTYFVPDKRKSGGKYVRENIRLKDIDQYERVLVTCDRRVISIGSIRDIQTEIFDEK